MELWRVCFDDTEEFIQFYFDKNTRRRMLWCIGMNKVRLLLLYKLFFTLMTFGVTQIVTGYISGACTHPSIGPGRDDEVTAGGFLRDERKKDSREYSDSG